MSSDSTADSTLLSSKKTADIDNSSFWGEIRELKCSDEGASGAFICVTPDKRSIVVKTGMSIAQELFAMTLANKIGSDVISVPQIRLVQYVEEEWSIIKDRLLILSRSTAKREKVQKQLNRPFYMVMEYIDGYPLGGLPNPLLIKTPHILYQIGKMLAFDVLVNNWDRLPLIWNNDGNLMNIFVQFPDGQLDKADEALAVGIDQAVTCLKDVSETAKGLTLYTEKISKLLDQLVEGKMDSSRIKSSVEMWTGVQLDEQDGSHLQRGVLEGLISISHNITINDIQTLIEDMQKMVKIDCDNIWADMVKLIQIDYFEKVLSVINERMADLEKAKK